MSTQQPEPSFDGDDTATIADSDVIAYDAVVARIAAEHPAVPVADVEELVKSENEALTGGVPLVVPAAVLGGVEEVLARERSTSEP